VPQRRNIAAHLWQVVEKASSRVPWNHEIPLAPPWRTLASCRDVLVAGDWTPIVQAALGAGTGSSLRFLQPTKAIVPARTAAAIHMGFMAPLPLRRRCLLTVDPGASLRGPAPCDACIAPRYGHCPLIVDPGVARSLGLHLLTMNAGRLDDKG